MPFPQTSFETRDANLTVTRALPAQNTTVTSSSIDLGTAEAALVGTLSDLVVTIPATTTATGQSFTVTVQDSADNSSFAAVPALAARAITGVSNATAAAEFRWRFPSTVRRYIRLSIAASATTGDQTAISATATVRT